MKQLCKTHINRLSKVATQLAYKQTMTYTQLILGEKNKQRVEEAEQLIYKAINLLKQVI